MKSVPLEWPDAPVSFAPLPPGEPTEAQLRAAGGMGGPLSPLDNATPGKVAPLLAAQGKKPKEIALATARLKKINVSFGEALRALKSHDFARTVKLYTEHLEEFPDSPWAGEANLHLGKWAMASGRYAEAEARYRAILEVTGDTPDEFSYDMAQKTKVAWANLDITLGRWNGAQAKLNDILATEKHWRRRTWARYFSMRVNVASRSRSLQACGAHAVSALVKWRGNTKAAARLAKLEAPREAGFSMAELQTLGTQNGLKLRGFRARIEDLSSLPLPLMVHYDFGATPRGAVLCEHCVPGKEVSFRIARRPHALKAAYGAAMSQSSGHFLILRAVNLKKGTVTIYNPLEQSNANLSFAQFEREWSGTGLVIDNPVPFQAPRLAKTVETRVQTLSRAQMAKIFGACCCVDGQVDDIGNNENNVGCAGPSCNGMGSPAFAVNPVNMNFFVHDTPLWFESQGGLDFALTMNYNSEQSLQRGSMFGTKWSTLYDSYLTLSGADAAQIVLGDGRSIKFTKSGTTWQAQGGVYDRLTQPSSGRFVLGLEDGGTMTYSTSPTSNELWLVSIVDDWGNTQIIERTGSNVTAVGEGFNIATYNATGAKITRFSYNTGATHPFKVTDPFGRTALFSYNGEKLYRVTDMQGQVTQYGYNGDNDISEVRVASSVANLTTAEARVWTIFLEYGNAGNPGNFQYYPPVGQDPVNPSFNSLLAGSRRVTLTDAMGEKEEFFFDALHEAAGRLTASCTWHVDKRFYRAPNTRDGSGVLADNGTRAVPKQVWHLTPLVVPGRGTHGVIDEAFFLPSNRPDKEVIAQYNYDSNLDVVNAIIDGRGNRYNIEYNPDGTVKEINDGRNTTRPLYRFEWSLQYVNTLHPTRAIRPDLTKVYDRGNVGSSTTDRLIAETQYGPNHNPLIIKSGFNGTAPLMRRELTYTTWGEVASANKFAVSNTSPYERVIFNFNSTTRRLDWVDQVDLDDGSLKKIAQFTYDPTVTYRVASATDAFGIVTKFLYDNLDRVVKTTFEDQTTEITDYCDSCGAVESVINRNGEKTTNTLNKAGRVSVVYEPDGRQSSYQYYDDGSLKSVFDSSNTGIFFDYDQRGRLIRKTYPSLTNGLSRSTTDYETWTYDLNNNPLIHRRVDGSTETFGYEAKSDRMNSVRYTNPSGAPLPAANLDLIYDNEMGRLDQLIHADSAVGTYSYEYDTLGRITTAFEGDTRSYNYSGDRVSRTRSGPSQQYVSYNYDGLNRLLSVGSGAGVFTYSYDPTTVGYSTQPTKVTWPGTSGSLNYTYESTFGRLANITARLGDSTFLSSYGTSYGPAAATIPSLARDIRTSANSKQRLSTGVLEGTHTLTWTSQAKNNRLQGEVSSGVLPQVNNEFSYDNNDNPYIFKDRIAGSERRFNSNNFNQIDDIMDRPVDYDSSTGDPIYAQYSLSYDRNGNTKRQIADYSGTVATDYTYDHNDRLISLTRYNRFKTGAAYYLGQSRFVYDVFGNMKRVYEDKRNATNSAWEADKWTDYSYLGGQIIEERTSTGEKVRYTWGAGRDGGGGALLSRSVSVGTAWRNYNVVSDSSGNVASLVRQDTGLVVANYRYGAYKLIQSRGIDAGVTADATDRAQVSAQSLLYQSKWQHKPSGLVNFGYRFYNPATYSWINRDPLGEAGGLNLYSYVGGMPHNAFDPWGLDWVDSVVDFSAGWGDSLTFGATKYGRLYVGGAVGVGDANAAVNYCSGAYRGGELTGTAHSLAFGGAGAAKAGSAVAARGAAVTGTKFQKLKLQNYLFNNKGEALLGEYNARSGITRLSRRHIREEALEMGLSWRELTRQTFFHEQFHKLSYPALKVANGIAGRDLYQTVKGKAAIEKMADVYGVVGSKVRGLIRGR